MGKKDAKAALCMLNGGCGDQETGAGRSQQPWTNAQGAWRSTGKDMRHHCVSRSTLLHLHHPTEVCPPARRTEHPGHQPPVRDSQVQCIELEYSFCRGVRMSATSTPETSLVTVRLAGRDDLRSTTAQPAIACPPGNPLRPTYHQPHLAHIAVPPCRRAPTLLVAQY